LICAGGGGRDWVQIRTIVQLREGVRKSRKEADKNGREFF